MKAETLYIREEAEKVSGELYETIKKLDSLSGDLLEFTYSDIYYNMARADLLKAAATLDLFCAMYAREYLGYM